METMQFVERDRSIDLDRSSMDPLHARTMLRVTTAAAHCSGVTLRAHSACRRVHSAVCIHAAAASSRIAASSSSSIRPSTAAAGVTHEHRRRGEFTHHTHTRVFSAHKSYYTDASSRSTPHRRQPIPLHDHRSTTGVGSPASTHGRIGRPQRDGPRHQSAHDGDAREQTVDGDLRTWLPAELQPLHAAVHRCRRARFAVHNHMLTVVNAQQRSDKHSPSPSRAVMYDVHTGEDFIDWSEATPAALLRELVDSSRLVHQLWIDARRMCEFDALRQQAQGEIAQEELAFLLQLDRGAPAPSPAADIGDAHDAAAAADADDADVDHQTAAAAAVPNTAAADAATRSESNPTPWALPDTAVDGVTAGDASAASDPARLTNMNVRIYVLRAAIELVDYTLPPMSNIQAAQLGANGAVLPESMRPPSDSGRPPVEMQYMHRYARRWVARRDALAFLPDMAVLARQDCIAILPMYAAFLQQLQGIIAAGSHGDAVRSGTAAAADDDAQQQERMLAAGGGLAYTAAEARMLYNNHLHMTKELVHCVSRIANSAIDMPLMISVYGFLRTLLSSIRNFDSDYAMMMHAWDGRCQRVHRLSPVQSQAGAGIAESAADDAAADDEDAHDDGDGAASYETALLLYSSSRWLLNERYRHMLWCVDRLRHVLTRSMWTLSLWVRMYALQLPHDTAAAAYRPPRNLVTAARLVGHILSDTQELQPRLSMQHVKQLVRTVSAVQFELLRTCAALPYAAQYRRRFSTPVPTFVFYAPTDAAEGTAKPDGAPKQPQQQQQYKAEHDFIQMQLLQVLSNVPAQVSAARRTQAQQLVDGLNDGLKPLLNHLDALLVQHSSLVRHRVMEAVRSRHPDDAAAAGGDEHADDPLAPLQLTLFTRAVPSQDYANAQRQDDQQQQQQGSSSTSSTSSPTPRADSELPTNVAYFVLAREHQRLWWRGDTVPIDGIGIGNIMPAVLLAPWTHPAASGSPQLHAGLSDVVHAVDNQCSFDPKALFYVLRALYLCTLRSGSIDDNMTVMRLYVLAQLPMPMAMVAQFTRQLHSLFGMLRSDVVTQRDTLSSDVSAAEDNLVTAASAHPSVIDGQYDFKRIRQLFMWSQLCMRYLSIQQFDVTSFLLRSLLYLSEWSVRELQRLEHTRVEAHLRRHDLDEDGRDGDVGGDAEHDEFIADESPGVSEASFVDPRTPSMLSRAFYESSSALTRAEVQAMFTMSVHNFQLLLRQLYSQPQWFQSAHVRNPPVAQWQVDLVGRAIDLMSGHGPVAAAQRRDHAASDVYSVSSILSPDDIRAELGIGGHCSPMFAPLDTFPLLASSSAHSRGQVARDAAASLAALNMNSLPERHQLELSAWLARVRASDKSNWHRSGWHRNVHAHTRDVASLIRSMHDGLDIFELIQSISALNLHLPQQTYHYALQRLRDSYEQLASEADRATSHDTAAADDLVAMLDELGFGDAQYRASEATAACVSAAAQLLLGMVGLGYRPLVSDLEWTIGQLATATTLTAQFYLDALLHAMRKVHMGHMLTPRMYASLILREAVKPSLKEAIQDAPGEALRPPMWYINTAKARLTPSSGDEVDDDHSAPTVASSEQAMLIHNVSDDAADSAGMEGEADDASMQWYAESEDVPGASSRSDKDVVPAAPGPAVHDMVTSMLDTNDRVTLKRGPRGAATTDHEDAFASLMELAGSQPRTSEDVLALGEVMSRVGMQWNYVLSSAGFLGDAMAARAVSDDSVVNTDALRVLTGGHRTTAATPPQASAAPSPLGIPNDGSTSGAFDVWITRTTTVDVERILAVLDAMRQSGSPPGMTAYRLAMMGALALSAPSLATPPPSASRTNDRSVAAALLGLSAPRAAQRSLAAQTYHYAMLFYREMRAAGLLPDVHSGIL